VVSYARHARYADEERRHRCDVTDRRTDHRSLSWFAYLDFSRRHYRDALLDCAGSTAHTFCWGESATASGAVPGALVCLRINRDQSFLESLPVWLRCDAGQ